MSFNDEYLKLRKKRLKEEEKKTDSSISPSGTAMVYSSHDIEADDDIAPVKQTTNTSTDDDKKWYQKIVKASEAGGDDGWSFFDVLKATDASTRDLMANVRAGALKGVEGAIDIGATIIGGVGGLLGADGFQDKMSEFVAKDIINEKKIATDILDPINGGWASKLIYGNKTEDIEPNSVFGDTADTAAQTVGDVLMMYAMPGEKLKKLYTFGTAFIGGVENAFQNDATYGEAVVSGGIDGILATELEKWFGAIGFGGAGKVDDLVTRTLSEKISNRLLRTGAKLGIDFAGEGAEEFVEEVGSRFGRWITYQDEETWQDMFASEEAFDSYAESFFLGGFVGDIFGGAKAVALRADGGRDYTTGTTVNEEAVVKAVYDERVAEAEEGGKKLTNKEKNKIYSEVMEDLEKGRISIDNIERYLGGDTYMDYKNTINEEDSLIKEYEELGNMKEADFTVMQRKRFNELDQQVADIKANNKRGQLKQQLSESTFNLAKDSRLVESYNEKARRSQAFEADLSKYDTTMQETVKKAVESGILNNTNRTHEFVDIVAKISADKGVPFDFTNNEKLKESGFAVEGKTVNGVYTKDGISLNMDSKKAWQTTVGHEITHVLEGTELYAELQNSLFEYAKSKGDYDGRVESLKSLYKGVKDANIDAELTADLVGEYLFTDSDFVNNLSVKHRNVFQKIYDEIKYLWKMVTAGSKEARELEKVKRVFDEAYRKSGTRVSETDATGETKYSLVEDQETIDFLENQDYITVYKAMSQIDGKLYPPMASQTYVEEEYTTKKGEKKTRRVRKLKNPSVLGRWQQAEERPDIAEKTYDAKKGYSSFDLLKSNGKTTGGVAYNPYEHTSNIVLNDQFAEAYQRPELVTVEYHIPKSELTSGYKAQYAKDAVGLTDWKAGGVAQKLQNSHRDVYLTRWSKPVRVLSDAEVAQKYKEILDKEEGISVPWNVVTPSLRAELEKVGVPIDYSDIKAGSSIRNFEVAMRGDYAEKPKKAKYSLSTDSEGKQLSMEQSDYFKDSKNADIRYSLSEDMGDASSRIYDMQVEVNNLRKSISEFESTEEFKSQMSKLSDAIAKNDIDNGVRAYQEWRVTSGYDALLNKRDNLQAELDNLRKEVSDIATNREIEKEKAAIAKSGLSEADYFRKQAVKEFGYTPYFYDAGYITPNGKMLNFSGEKGYHYGGRGQDHRAIGTIYANTSGTDALNRFVKDGNIRIMAESPGIDISTVTEPTKEQYATIRKFIYEYADKDFFNVDLTDETGRVIGSLQYENRINPTRILNDIKHYYATGEIREQSNIDRFRFSLSEDSEGRGLSPAVKNRFANTKVVDDNGDLKVVYHGTASGEFSIFDKSKGSVEGDYGSGFYFTDNEYDVTNNYEGGGPDFDNKVSRRADEIYNEIYNTEDDVSYEEAERRAKAELYKGSHKFEVYLNIENPAIVGETILFDPDSYYSEYNQEDYDNEDDYYGDVEQLIADDVDNAIWDIERNVDVTSTDGIADVLWGAFNEGGVDLEKLKARINNLYLEDSNGNLVGNEVARQIIESLGYDGIIDPTVSSKWNMDMEEGTTHYIVFKPNQIKAVTNQDPTDNPDIHKSLSFKGEAPVRFRGSVPMSDMRLETEDIAPVQEDVAKIAKTAPTISKMEQVEDFAPITEEEANALQSERIASLDDADAPPEADAPYYGEGESVALSDPFENRDMKAVSKDRKVKAYMYENPEVKPFFQEEANVMLGELLNTTKGERFYTEVEGGVPGEYGAESYGVWTGTSRHTSDDIAYLLDTVKMSYDDIEKGLKAIIEDNGAENIAAAKKIEFVLNDRLMHGYRDLSGYEIPADQNYINLLNEKQIREYSEEARKNFFEVADEYAPPAEDDIAPVAEQYEAIRPKQSNEPRLKRVKVDDDIAPTATYETAKKGQLNGQRTMFAEGKTAEILTEEPKNNRGGRNAWSMLKNNVFDKGMVFEDLSLETGNRELQARWNSIRYAEGKAQKLIGEGNANVSSLKSIQETIENSGKTKQFYEYLYHLHNVDRMSLEDKAMPTIMALRGKFGNLKEAQIRAIAAKEITDNTTERTANTIREAREYLRAMETKNKPVFGDSVTAEVSREIATKLEKANPEFKEYAQEVYDYMNYLREMLVDGGVISSDTAKLWSEMYPHYVPIRRDGQTGLNINVPLDTGKTGVNAPIKRATGGNSDILPLFDTMALRTEQTYKAIAKNRFGVELKNTLGTTIADEATSLDDAIDSVDAQDGLLQEGKNGKSPTFTVFENGKKVTFEITEEMYDAIKPTSKGLSYTNKVANTAGNIFRGLLTEYNPVFMTTNAVKDVQDILINSQHAAKTYATIPKAIKEMATGGRWYQEYLENGGEQNTYFDNQTNTFKAEDKGIKKVIGMPLRGISYINNTIEKVPRLAEYIASRESGASIDVAMLDAARVTTNFAAGGDLTKALNRNGFTFLNASMQGAVQQVRNVREAKANGLKGWMQLATKVAIAGLPALILNDLLWDDDEEYEELSDYVKQNYYVVAKFGDGKFVRIPKGRTLAVIQNAFEQMENAITGDDEVDLKNFLELAISNLAPNNPLENNILAPIMQVKNNETWYGEDLVPTRLQDLPEAEQFDESTDALSKWLGEKLEYSWLGEKLDFSPYKINYLLNQYSGGVGDVVLPMLTPEAESGDNSLVGNMIAPMKDKFTTDSVMNNQNVSDFYDTVDELTKNAKSSKATDEDVLMYKYMNSINSELGELYKQKREIQNSNLEDSEKYEAVREIQEQINSLARESLNTYGRVYIRDGYAKVGDLHYRLNDNGEWQKISDKQLENQEEVTNGLGIDPSEYWSNKTEYDFAFEYPEKYAVAKSVGGYDKYKTYSSELYDIKADKDENGKSITGSRKEKVIEYINNLDADYGEKIILFKSEYNADDTYNYDIIDYLNSRNDISYKEMEAILKELGFEVDSKGNIYW